MESNIEFHTRVISLFGANEWWVVNSEGIPHSGPYDSKADADGEANRLNNG